MLNKILTIFQFLIIISFLLLTNFYYFSDKNIEKINKNRVNLSSKISKSLDELPFLINDTNNIIEYQNNDTNLEKIKKRSFWDLLNSNE
tara:strand:+ start:603 stop:869 length:267 start_codon:yes stop_codon:yes gene_type:complete